MNPVRCLTKGQGRHVASEKWSNTVIPVFTFLTSFCSPQVTWPYGRTATSHSVEKKKSSMQPDIAGPGAMTSWPSRLNLMEFCFFQFACLSSSTHNSPHIAWSSDTNMEYRMVVHFILQPSLLLPLKENKSMSPQPPAWSTGLDRQKITPVFIATCMSALSLEL